MEQVMIAEVAECITLHPLQLLPTLLSQEIVQALQLPEVLLTAVQYITQAPLQLSPTAHSRKIV
jgi:hypothetical protein